MKLENIEGIVKSAERSENKVIESSFRYSQKLDGYIHARTGEVPDELRPVTPRELYRETQRFVESIERHEEQLNELEDVARALENISDHRIMPDRNVSKSSIESRLSDVYETYIDNREHAAEVAFRGERVQKAPNPLDMKSILKRDVDQFEYNMPMLEKLKKGY